MASKPKLNVTKKNAVFCLFSHENQKALFSNIHEDNRNSFNQEEEKVCIKICSTVDRQRDVVFNGHQFFPQTTAVITAC